MLTTKDLIYSGRSSNIEVNSADSAVMEIVKSNMTDMVPFQLLYYGASNGSPTCSSVTNNAVCQSGVTTEIPINQAYIGGDTANISINVII